MACRFIRFSWLAAVAAADSRRLGPAERGRLRAAGSHGQQPAMTQLPGVFISLTTTRRRHDISLPARLPTMHYHEFRRRAAQRSPGDAGRHQFLRWPNKNGAAARHWHAGQRQQIANGAVNAGFSSTLPAYFLPRARDFLAAADDDASGQEKIFRRRRLPFRMFDAARCRRERRVAHNMRLAIIRVADGLDAPICRRYGVIFDIRTRLLGQS